MAYKHEIQEKLLDPIIASAAFDGWTMQMMLQEAKQLEISPAAVRLAFPRGGMDAFLLWMQRDNTRVEASMLPNLADEPSMTVRVKQLTQARLMMLAEQPEAFRRGLAVMSVPGRHGELLGIYREMANFIWLAAGDRSADMSYHTKRMLLGYILKTTSLRLSSQPDGDWQEFMERRFSEVMRVGKLASRIPDPVKPLDELLHWLRRIPQRR
jgi:ubiquinone biosynthesis protein COQ9